MLKKCLAFGDNYVRTVANARLDPEYVFATLERWKFAYCLMECSNQKERCGSVNYHNAQQICELNRFFELTEIDEGEKKLKKSQPGWTFYGKDANVKDLFFLRYHFVCF